MIYTKEPEGFISAGEVVGCFVECSGEFLLLRRSPTDSFGNYWGLPAGGVDPGETPIFALLREVFEETGLRFLEDEIELIEKFFVVSSRKTFVFYQYRSVALEKPTIVLNPEEHKEYAWVDPQQALEKLLMPDLDLCIKHVYPESF